MAKATKKVEEKKEFAWDTEKKIGEFGDAKKKTEVRICTLNDKTYVSSQSYVMSAKTGDWKRTKNNTMEMSLFKEIQGIVGDWELGAAFGSTEILQAPAPKKPTRKETEKAISKALKTEESKKSGGLKAKKQAAGAKEAASKRKKAEK